MSATVDLLKEHAKTIGAFVLGVIANMIVSLTNGEVPFPQTTQEWQRYLITSFGAAIGAYAVRNKITQKQLDKDKGVVGAVVLPEVGKAVNDAVTNTIQDVTAHIPTAGPVVKEVTDQVNDAVERVIREYQSRALR